VSCKLAAKTFDLNPEEMENRHHLTFDTYEEGKLTLEEYLGRVVFYQKRRSPGLSFGASCSRNRSLTQR
jgi:hypothetical protein